MKAVLSALFAVVLCSANLDGIQVQEFSRDSVDAEMGRAANLLEQGHTAESKKIYEQLLKTMRDRPATSQLGFVLNGLSKISAAEGDYKGAIELAKQAASVYQGVGDSNGQAHSLNNQGIGELQLGKYAAAQQTLLAALSLSQSSGDPENQVQVLNNLGSSFYFPGSYSEALYRYNEAMNLVAQNYDEKWSDYWRQITSFNRATLFQRLGQYEDALQIYRQVERSSKALTPSDMAHLYANLGALYRRLGDPYKALDTYRAAQKLYAGQHDAGGELTVLKNIGIVYALDMQDLTRAEKIFGSAIALAEGSKNRREEMQAHLYRGETFFRASNATSSRVEFDRSLAIAQELGTSEEQWKSIYGLGKVEEVDGNTSLAEENYRRAVAIIEKTRSQLQLSALRSDFFADKREAYDALIGLLMKKRDVSESFLFLERSRSRNFQDRLHPSGAESTESLTLESIRKTLNADTALLEFWASGDQVGLIWCSRQGSGLNIAQLSPFQLREIRELLDGVPNILGDDWKKRFQTLAPLLPENAEYLKGVKHILIVPDGWITYVPFDMVPVTQKSNLALIERFDLTYLPTAAVLRRNTIPQSYFLPPWTQELVAFGDPSIDPKKDTSGADEPEGNRSLKFSSQEVRNIADLVDGRKDLLLGKKDLKHSFLGPASNTGLILHVSTHAFADGDNPENSRLLFSPTEAGGDPEYVYLREMYDLKLDRVRLATISACDTERGKIIRGEGIQAFSRALLSAGAGASITTLWRVDDEATSQFMKQFYYLALREHKSKAEALRLTKLKFLHSNSKLADPRLWAAFVLNGDGATPLPSVWSWGELALLLCGLFAAIVAALAVFHLRSWRRIERQNDARTVVR